MQGVFVVEILSSHLPTGEIRENPCSIETTAILTSRSLGGGDIKPKVYIETTIPSYLTAWLSRDLVTAAHQQITREWWQTRRQHFDLFTAQLVIDEASEGDPDAATR